MSNLKTSLKVSKTQDVATRPKQDTIFDMVSKVKNQVDRALPKFMEGNADRFVRIALTELRNNTDLLEIASKNPQSFLGAFLTAAQLGLEVGPAMRQAYLIPYRGKEPKVQLLISYIGLTNLAMRAGVKKIDVLPIHSKELEEGRLKISYGIDEKLSFEPILFGDKGERLGYVAIAKMPDGSTKFKVYDMAFIEERKKVAKSDKFWNLWEEEMELKTVYRHFTKNLGLSPELAAQLNADERDITFDPKKDTLEDIDIHTMPVEVEEVEVEEVEIVEEARGLTKEDKIMNLFAAADQHNIDLISFAKKILGYNNLKNMENLRDSDLQKVEDALDAEIKKK